MTQVGIVGPVGVHVGVGAGPHQRHLGLRLRPPAAPSGRSAAGWDRSGRSAAGRRRPRRTWRSARAAFCVLRCSNSDSGIRIQPDRSRLSILNSSGCLTGGEKADLPSVFSGGSMLRMSSIVGQHVGGLHDLAVDLALLLAGRLDEQRDGRRSRPRSSRWPCGGRTAPLRNEHAVVGGQHDHRLVPQPLLLELGDQPLDLAVHEAHLEQVALLEHVDLALVLVATGARSGGSDRCRPGCRPARRAGTATARAAAAGA